MAVLFRQEDYPHVQVWGSEVKLCLPAKGIDKTASQRYFRDGCMGAVWAQKNAPSFDEAF